MKKKVLLIALMLVMMMSAAACSKKSVRVVIGSTSVTGDTYQIADIVTRSIAEEMDVDMKVDPIGSDVLFKELEKAGKDGSMIGFFHDYTFLGTLYGSYSENWLEKYNVGPTTAINAGTCLAVMENNKYNITDWASLVEAAKTNKIVFGIEEGSVSNFISAGVKKYLVENEGVPADNITFSALGGMSAQREALWAGTIDVYNGSYGSDIANTKEAGNTDAKTQMKIIAMTGKERLEGVNIPTLAELTGGELFYEKEFFFITTKDTDPAFIASLEAAVKNALENNAQLDEQFKTNYFQKHFISAQDSIAHFNAKMKEAESIIK
jgi:tripartite-type tricarboxylate transporter receptor subunit TctC